MSTPFSDINMRFLSKVSVYDWANFTDAQLDSQVLPYMENAVPKFIYSKQDLTYDTTTLTFVSDLTLLEKDIISSMMVVEWLSPLIFNTLLLKQQMTDQDFKMTSQANHLKQMQLLKMQMEQDIEKWTTRYDYLNINDLNEQNQPVEKTILPFGYGDGYYDF